ncbi:orotate phosphoribosyltransferase [Haloarcula brevis]|uniref:orotate phosphoribosyltransferase n=1 Tax=Haloarcula brevis TaxID=3111453 RepID=UPI00300F0A13
MTDVEGLQEGRLLQAGERYDGEFDVSAFSKILIVDDTVYKGGAMTEARETIESLDLPAETYYGAVYVDEGSERFVDTYAQTLPFPRVFEWNMMHHDFLNDACVDLDGILCRDPTPTENDDGANYRDFLTTVRPKCVPSVSIGRIVTCRLERYREETAAWLDEHGIEYDELVMMQYPNKAARVAAGDHAEYKADVYQSTDAKLFIESSHNQARKIARRTSKPVYSKERNVMLQQGYLHRVTREGRASIKAVQSNPVRYVNQLRSDPVDFLKRASSVFL